jgi:hypothetical protein
LAAFKPDIGPTKVGLNRNKISPLATSDVFRRGVITGHSRFFLEKIEKKRVFFFGV